MSCKKCGAEAMCISPTIFKNGTEHLERICFECGAHNGYAPQPMTIERAEQQIVFFGKHKDLTLGRIMTIDSDYVHWMADKFDKNDKLAIAARVLLGKT